MDGVRKIARAAALCCALAACAPERQAAGPRTEAPRIDAGALIAGDGARLPLHVWLPEGPPRAVVLGVHGFNDYGNGFAIPAAAWTQAGLAVYAYDQRGFGAAPAPGIWPEEETLIGDADDAAAAVAARHPGLALYAVGVSMGGAVLVAALAEGKLRGIAGAALAAPAVWARETMPLPHRAALWLAAHLAPGLRLSAEGLDIVPSDNDEMLRAFGADPLVIKKTRVDAALGAVDLMDRAFAAAPALAAAAPPPLLLLYGARDEIVPKAPTARAACALGAAARRAVYPQGYHMLLRDLGAAAVHADMAAWIADPSAPLPSDAEDEARRFFSCADGAPAGEQAP